MALVRRGGRAEDLQRQTPARRLPRRLRRRDTGPAGPVADETGRLALGPHAAAASRRRARRPRPRPPRRRRPRKPDREIEQRLREELAAPPGMEPEQIDPTLPFAALGLRSAELIVLVGEFERWLGRALSPTVVWAYPTLEKLTEALAAGAATAPVGVRPGLPHRAGRRTRPETGTARRGRGRNPHRRQSTGPDRPRSTRPGRAHRDHRHRLPLPRRRGRPRQLLAAAAATAATRSPRCPPTAGTPPVLRRGPRRPGPHQHPLGRLPRRRRPVRRGSSSASRTQEAARMDPQQRLLAEVAWEALEDAGRAHRPARRSRHRRVRRHLHLRLRQPASSATSTPSTPTPAPAAPSASPRTGCRTCSTCAAPAWPSTPPAPPRSSRSSRRARACARGECDLALAGGVNLVLSPALAINFAKAGVMAPDGRCKPSTPAPTATCAPRAPASSYSSR